MPAEWTQDSRTFTMPIGHTEELFCPLPASRTLTAGTNGWQLALLLFYYQVLLSCWWALDQKQFEFHAIYDFAINKMSHRPWTRPSCWSSSLLFYYYTTFYTHKIIFAATTNGYNRPSCIYRSILRGKYFFFPTMTIPTTKPVETMMYSARQTRLSSTFPHDHPSSQSPSSFSAVFDHNPTTRRMILNMQSRWRPSSGIRQSSVQHLLDVLNAAIMISRLDDCPTDEALDALDTDNSDCQHDDGPEKD